MLFLLLLLYSILRAGFYIGNMQFYSDAASGEILSAFIHGLRFDVAAIFIINIPVLLLYNLPFTPIEKKWYKITILVLFLLINFVFIALSISDFGYFAAEQRRLLYEPYTMLPDIIRMISSSLAYHYVLFVILLTSTIVFVYVSVKFLKKLDNYFDSDRKYFTESLNFVLLVLTSVIAIRGGFQLKPLRQANAFESDSRSLGYLTLNTTYNVVLSAFQDVLPDVSVMPKPEAERTVLEMIKDDNEILIDSEYVFMRRKNFEGPPNKLNIVIFIMESWSAKYCGSITNGKTSTPFFDSLASQGILFKNFFATGQRSIEAIPSILTSVPSLYNLSIINSTAEMDDYRGLGSILGEEGYITSFHHGASIGSMGFDGFSGIAGFTKYYGKEDFDGLPSGDFDGAWGIYDEPFFLETEKILSEYKEPFCSVIFSLSSHDPYKIPDNRLALFSKYRDEGEFERSIRYSDYSLRRFFETSSAEPWYMNTLFVITGDHTLFNSRDNFYSTFHIPMLLYTPSGLLPHSENELVASHIDILPSILDIILTPAVHSSMGVSVLSQKKERYCCEKYGNDYCIINENYVLLDNLESKSRLYNYKSDPSLKYNLAEKYPKKLNELKRKLLAYLQSTTEAIADNKIYKEVR